MGVARTEESLHVVARTPSTRPARWHLAPGQRGRRARGGPGAQRDRRRSEHRADPVRGHARRAGEPLPAPGRPAGGGVDREGAAALPVARLRLRPPHRASHPGTFGDAVNVYEIEERDDGVYVRLPEQVEVGRTVADVLVETLVAHGVTRVFGMVGHSNLGFADALRRAEERGELTYIGIRHEGAAAFAASAYGKLTGRPAACFAIAGPGSTNLLTGLYDAKLDQSPVIAISGQVPSKVLGRGAFQDLDLSAVFKDVAITTTTVQSGSDHAELAAIAVKHARDGRGVAHLVLPDEVQALPSRRAGRVARRPLLRPAGPTRRAAARARGQAGRGRQAAGAHRRPRRSRRRGRGRRAGRAAARAGADHLQGQGAGARHPPARRRSPRPQRYAGRELADERVRPARGGRCVLLQPHRHRAVQADRADRRQPRPRSVASTP